MLLNLGSPLYPRLVRDYRDEMPAGIRSSLDPGRHRLGSDPDKQDLFETFLVDYVLTRPPYRARDVRLAFGVSDHAAVMAEIVGNR